VGEWAGAGKAGRGRLFGLGDLEEWGGSSERADTRGCKEGTDKEGRRKENRMVSEFEQAGAGTGGDDARETTDNDGWWRKQWQWQWLTLLLLSLLLWFTLLLLLSSSSSLVRRRRLGSVD